MSNQQPTPILDELRDKFEDLALMQAIKQRALGLNIDDNGCELTRESLFWRNPNAPDDYGVAQFNAAWWGFKMGVAFMMPKNGSA